MTHNLRELDGMALRLARTAVAGVVRMPYAPTFNCGYIVAALGRMSLRVEFMKETIDAD
jgi:hypothetical protein